MKSKTTISPALTTSARLGSIVKSARDIWNET